VKQGLMICARSAERFVATGRPVQPPLAFSPLAEGPRRARAENDLIVGGERGNDFSAGFLMIAIDTGLLGKDRFSTPGRDLGPEFALLTRASVT